MVIFQEQYSTCPCPYTWIFNNLETIPKQRLLLQLYLLQFIITIINDIEKERRLYEAPSYLALLGVATNSALICETSGINIGWFLMT